MKKFGMALSAFLLCLGMTLMSGTAFAKDNSVNAGFMTLPGIFDTEATVFFVEYERSLNKNLSLIGRAGLLDYSFDDGSYVEDGDGPGLDVGLRFYPRGEGFYLGGSVGLWWTEWTYVDSYYFFAGPLQFAAGTGESTALKVEFEVGAKFPIGRSPVSIMPSFHLGSFISVDDSCNSTFAPGFDCGKESEVGVFGVAGVAASFAF